MHEYWRYFALFKVMLRKYFCFIPIFFRCEIIWKCFQVVMSKADIIIETHRKRNVFTIDVKRLKFFKNSSNL